jgi:hypothetical protein
VLICALAMRELRRSHVTFIAGLGLSLAACSGANSGEADAQDRPDAVQSADARPDGSSQPGAAALNEVYKKQPGTDFHEMVELHGDADTDYAHLTIVVLESDADAAGTVDATFPVGTTDADGLWATPFQEEVLENGSITVLLVDGFTGTLDADLDPDDDGTLDAEPWAAILDSVALTDDPAAHPYSATVLDPAFDGGTDELDGAARIPDGAATWVRHDPDGNGLAGLAGAGGQLCAECGANPPIDGTALVTPAAPNQLAQLTAPDPIINEIYKKQPGTDFHEFVEIVGAPDTDYSAYTVVILEGDAGTGAGVIDRVYPIGTTGADGLFAIPFVSDEIENGSETVLLVRDYTGTLAADLDAGDDGTLDTSPWAAVADAVALSDADDAVPYAAIVITNAFDGGTEEPDGVARVPDGANTGTLADWVRHDPSATGLAGVAGAGGELCAECGVDPGVSGTAIITPGTANATAP